MQVCEGARERRRYHPTAATEAESVPSTPHGSEGLPETERGEVGLADSASRQSLHVCLTTHLALSLAMARRYSREALRTRAVDSEMQLFRQQLVKIVETSPLPTPRPRNVAKSKHHHAEIQSND